MTCPGAAALQGLVRLLPLFRELTHLKRIRVAGEPGSVAQRLFRRSWLRLIAGEEPEAVALQETAHAVAVTCLAGIDAKVLANGGLDEAERRQIFRCAYDSVATGLENNFAALLKGALTAAPLVIPAVEAPSFVDRLAEQPRAGATRPGHPRAVLEPAENHAEHCAIVAVNAVLAASCFGGSIALPFVTGLTHHAHNAYLPDAGDAGDTMLGEHHSRLMETFREKSLSQIPASLRVLARDSLDAVYRADLPEARSFQAADSLDRVLEMEWHARSAAFTLDTALGELDIIHPGPVQAFQLEIMRATGFMCED